MDALPPELLLHFFPFLPLTSLIAARSVDTRWRSLARTATLHPARKALLDLYLAAIVHPNFPSIVAALRPYLRPFDREAYIADLTARECVLPDLFELWVLEWPSNAVHFWAWPGLAKHIKAAHDNYYFDGVNLLGDGVPTIDTLPMRSGRRTSIGNKTRRGLALWQICLRLGLVQMWLVVNTDEKINEGWIGRVVWTFSFYVSEADGTEHLGPKRAVADAPLLVDNLIEFLDLLDVRCSDLAFTSFGMVLPLAVI